MRAVIVLYAGLSGVSSALADAQEAPDASIAGAPVGSGMTNHSLILDAALAREKAPEGGR
jgi:hypothetical protein